MMTCACLSTSSHCWQLICSPLGFCRRRFLCALPPEQREDWARGWARLIATGGELVTMMFPVDPEKEGGPPYAVSPELYTELLTPVGECGFDLEAGCSTCMID